MNAALLRLVLAAAARSVERGTLIEIVDTAARLLDLIRPLLDPANGPTPQAHTPSDS